MKTSSLLLIFFFALLSFSCTGQNKSVAHNSAATQKTKVTPPPEKPVITFITHERPVINIKNYGGENNKLFAFVGHKISVTAFAPEERAFGSMDAGFKAKYLVVQKVHGEFSRDTIEFLAYDHYGTPPFSQFEDVLLFVSADSGVYYHQKYMYNDVYKTKGGRWSGSYATEDYGQTNNKDTKIKPVKIAFKKAVSYATTFVDNSGVVLNLYFPQPYFKIVGDKAIAVYGNYVEELFLLKRNGYLTSRGLF